MRLFTKYPAWPPAAASEVCAFLLNPVFYLPTLCGCSGCSGIDEDQAEPLRNLLIMSCLALQVGHTLRSQVDMIRCAVLAKMPSYCHPGSQLLLQKDTRVTKLLCCICQPWLDTWSVSEVLDTASSRS